MAKSKFNVGDHVTNTQTGIKVSGTVVGIITGNFYLLRKQLPDIPHWSEHYKEWSKKCVYFLQLDKPTPQCTIAEFVKHRPEEVTEMQAVMQFQKIPLTDHMAYPEEDLRKI